MQYLESFLDRYTMYRVVLSVLSLLVVTSYLFSILGWLSYSLKELSYLLAVILIVSIATHYLVKFITKSPANFDSTLITVFILFFLYLPTDRMDELLGIALVSVVAVVGKYIFSYQKLHLVNPAALAAVLVGLTGLSFASWWIATPVLLPVIAVGGLLIAIKLRRLGMVIAGIISALGTFAVINYMRGSFTIEDLEFFFLYTPVIFFFFIMVTEPLTTPGTQRLRIVYGILLGVLSNIPFVSGPFYNTPELTLVIANLLFYPFSLRKRLELTLIDKKVVASQTLELSFKSSQKFTYQAGQYLEWTLAHDKQDSRGIRRYFTIASAPSEDNIKIAVRLSEKGSSFKQRLQELASGEVVYATARGGDFVLPKEAEPKKYIFVAGGIGVTPFRSIVKEQLSKGENLDAVLFYLNKTESDIAYKTLFDDAGKIGLKTCYHLDEPGDIWGGEIGHLTESIVTERAPDFKDRLVYISGPPGLVQAYTKLFARLGVPKSQIKTDYFPGLA